MTQNQSFSSKTIKSLKNEEKAESTKYVNKREVTFCRLHTFAYRNRYWFYSGVISRHDHVCTVMYSTLYYMNYGFNDVEKRGWKITYRENEVCQETQDMSYDVVWFGGKLIVYLHLDWSVPFQDVIFNSSCVRLF